MKGILVVGHGSTYPNSEKLVRMHCNALASRRPEKVYYAFYKPASDKLSEVVSSIFYSDVDDLLVIPFAMSEGRLAIRDLPDALGIKPMEDGFAVSGDRKVHIRLGSPFGAHPEFGRLFSEQLERLGVSKDSVLIIAGYKSEVRSYNDTLVRIVDDLRSRGFADTVLVHLSDGQTDFDEGLDLAAKTDKPAVIVPLFISCGLHLQTEICSELELNTHTCDGIYIHGSVPVQVTVLQPLGLMDIMTEIIALEASEAFD